MHLNNLNPNTIKKMDARLQRELYKADPSTKLSAILAITSIEPSLSTAKEIPEIIQSTKLTITPAGANMYRVSGQASDILLALTQPEIQKGWAGHTLRPTPKHIAQNRFRLGS